MDDLNEDLALLSNFVFYSEGSRSRPNMLAAGRALDRVKAALGYEVPKQDTPRDPNGYRMCAQCATALAPREPDDLAARSPCDCALSGYQNGLRRGRAEAAQEAEAAQARRDRRELGPISITIPAPPTEEQLRPVLEVGFDLGWAACAITKLGEKDDAGDENPFREKPVVPS